MKRVGVALVLAALMVSLSACVWNLNDETQLGSLTVSISSGDGVGTLNFAGFQTVSFFVAEADAFRSAGFDNVPVALRPGGLDEGRDFFATNFDPSIMVDVSFQPFELPGDEVTDADGISHPIPRGSARTFAPMAYGAPGPVTFADLVVGKEYVVWIDGRATEPVFDDFLGFAFVRIRSGAPTTVSIDLSADRFDSFVESLYARYIEPRVPRFDVGQFSAILYSGTGSGTVSVFDTEGELITSEIQEYTNAVVFRIADPEFGFTVFLVAFFPEEPNEEEGFASLSVVLIENEGALEPGRSLYSIPELSYDDDDDELVFAFEPGTVVAIDGELSSFFDEFRFLFVDPETPVVVSQLGFSGGAPSRGGTFQAAVSGPGFASGEVGLLGSISISDVSFTFGNVVDVFDNFDFDFDFRDDDDFPDDDDFAFQIGDIGPAGGFIFYIDVDDDFDWTYLEAAPFDVGSSVWSNVDEDLPFPATLGGIGNGLANSLAIVGQAGHETSAAQLALEFSIEEGPDLFDDWFLPSSSELEAMRDNLHAFEEGAFVDQTYWSSTAMGTAGDTARFLDFSNFEFPFSSGPKNVERIVRPIRAFSIEEPGQ